MPKHTTQQRWDTKKVFKKGLVVGSETKTKSKLIMYMIAKIRPKSCKALQGPQCFKQ